jgi:uncharacterized protein (DUF1330 family)
MPSAYVIANVTVTKPVQYEGDKVWSSAAIMRLVIVKGV